jgi:hypothetical protein
VKRHATTIVLVLLAIGLGVWLFVDRDRVTEGEKQRREKSVFSAWRREELSRLEIVHEGETLVLTRDAKADAPWRMTSPREDRCDQQAVERLLTVLEFASVARKASEGGALGLDPPLASGSVSMGGLVIHFALGGPSPRPEGSSYFRVDHDPPIVVNKELTRALLQSSDAYRDRTVVPYLSIELARFQVKREGGGFTFERAGERTFRVADAGVLAANESLDHVWNALAEMRAEAFPKDADVEQLTAKPELTIVMTPKDAAKPPAELVLGGACPGHPNDVVVLRKTPTKVAACAPKSVLEALRAPPSAFVDHRPIPLRADEIAELHLEWVGDVDAGARPRAIDIARKGTGFHEREPVDRDLEGAELDAANVLVQRIATASAISVVKGGEPFTPVARATARFGDEEHVVEIGPLPGAGGASGAGDARVVMRRVTDGARLEVAPGVARRFVPRETSLRSRSLIEKGRRVTRVMLRCGLSQDVVDAGEGFRLVDPPGFETDSEIVALVDGLTRGKVDAWVSDTLDGGFGLSDDGCRVILGFEGGNAPMTIRFGAQGETGVYGNVEGSTDVFVVPRSIRDLAAAIYVSRASLRVDPRTVERLRVVVDGKPAAHTAPVALASLYADRVTRVGKGAGIADVGKPEITIDVTIADGGAPKHIVCGPLTSDEKRACGTDGIAATYLVAEARIKRLLGGPPDAGDANVARDGGPR